MRCTSVRLMAGLGLLLIMLPVLPGGAAPITNGALQRTWDRTDKPVAEGRAVRTWIWGPEPFTATLSEPYAESPNGQRQVQYFDKSRMEITQPDGDQSSPWYVTNGLLVVELVSGQMQIGDAEFQPRVAAVINVAGDADDPNGPTYATFGPLRDEPATQLGSLINQRVDRDGTISTDSGMERYNVIAAQRVTVPGLDHTVASPFWSFMNASGTVYENGQFVTAPLFSDPYYATGLPISEAYWANVKVAGTPRDVLLQCFERRCLTYTPDNPIEWQIEMGNVGRHYYEWRSRNGGTDCPWSGAFPDTLRIGDTFQTTLDFTVDGCEVGLAGTTFSAQGQTLRTVTFEPPIVAWDDRPAEAPSWQWQSSGVFAGQTDSTLGDAPYVQHQSGAYAATMTAYVIPQVGGPIIWVQGQWWEDGSNQLCLDDACRELAWANQPARHWFWALNTATGAVGITPDDVRAPLSAATTSALGQRVLASHCGDLERQVQELQARAEELQRELQTAESRLTEKQQALERALDSWTDDAAYLADGTLADAAMQEAISALGAQFTIELLPGLLASLLAPGYISVASAQLIVFLDTAYAMADMAITLHQMTTIVNEMFGLIEGDNGAFVEARQYAQQEGLQKLEQLIDLVEGLSDLSGIEAAYNEWFNAGLDVESLAGTLALTREELQAAADALDRCVQQDVSPAGLWTNDDGVTVEVVIESGSNVVSAIYLTNTDADCPLGGRRPEHLQGTFDGLTWTGVMSRCTKLEELVTVCGLSSVWQTPFTATFSGDTIEGTWRSEWYDYDSDDNPDTCDWTRDPSGDEDIPFVMTRLAYNEPGDE